MSRFKETDIKSANNVINSLVDILNETWGLLYPEDKTSWGYPGQVLNHIRVELELNKDKISELSRLVDAINKTSSSQIPRFVNKDGQIYAVTRYISQNNGKFHAVEKFNVTDQFEKVIQQFTQQSISIARKMILEGRAPGIKIICLCGSTKFKEEFEKQNRAFTLRNYIVLQPGFYIHQTNDNVSIDTKNELDELHLKKIEMSDMIFVINKDGYIGDSTRREIDYATLLKKPIIYMETEINNAQTKLEASK